MKKNIYMMEQLLNKNNIPLPKGIRKNEGGSSLEKKARCHALVAGSSRYSSLILNSGSSRKMSSIQDSFSYLHPYIGPSILMGDDSEIPTTGIGKIDFDNG